eukprot:Plantae.Rhodophyta-Purpureofilum_apyrenoidigerum.ctg15769.p1 GENE.Plantae.Rhodophyta-Purpureofilum_apyrenoidigerum.ctg15769~~Plantae.Rhodophyta-Purpureofilum_apyrenoidigerum.ctg15769.p1  ORF type:complete len:294 (+),score=57.20 Plantae.Rhodophyta-Purpureofilum_apyrenoidigerum.ctg15769:125-1006(+)
MAAFVNGAGVVTQWRRGGAAVSTRCTRRSGRVVCMAETQKKITLTLDEENQKLYSRDGKTGEQRELSMQEKEELFLDATNALFQDKTPAISDDMLDALRDELSWEGSNVVTLNNQELRFLECARAYKNGESVVSDEEYDYMKDQLKKAGSKIVIRKGARCSVVTQICASDMSVDKTRQLVLFLPAAGITALAWAFTAYEFTPLRLYNPLVSFLVGLPIIFAGSKVLTGAILPDPTILAGPCPSCEADIRVYFGNICGVQGFGDTANTKCSKCKTQIKVEKLEQRAETIPRKLG